MGDYLLVSHAPGDEAAASLSGALARLAVREGFATSVLNPHAWLASRGAHPPSVVQVGPWTLIGDVFNRRAPALHAIDRDDPLDYERKLVARFWGRFVGVMFGRGDRPLALLRDPSGALECVTWEQDGLTFVASSLEAWLVERLRPGWSLNPGRLAQALEDLVAPTGPLAIDGPTALEPGTVQSLPPTRPPETIWSPAEHAIRSLGPAPSPETAMESVRTAIDEAVAGLAGLPGPVAAEVSGGLDSSIVASSLVRCAPDEARLWLNAYGATPESDERAFAAEIGRFLGFSPSCFPHATGPITTDWLDAISGDLRPGLNALDYPQDLAWASHVRAARARAVMTGKGGDSILFQAATTDVFTDLWLSRGWRALLWPDLSELAAANEISVWSMIRDARRHARFGHAPLRRNHPILPPRDDPGPCHPWLCGLEAFGPAKRFQIAGVADSVSHHGPSVLTRAVDMRHPLCAQPVIEACLALPTALLAIGGRDRGLARRAFLDRLPAQIARRRSKGEMTRIYSRLVADNLGVLRPWLLDGRLVALGLIDRAMAEVELTPEALIWRGQSAFILTAAAVEGWTRRWEARLAPARGGHPTPTGYRSAS